MKPEWNDETPYWANYLAQDESGAWYWFEDKPKLGPSGNWHVVTGDCQEALSNPDWTKTLEQRPC
jgi:hypothetical protein